MAGGRLAWTRSDGAERQVRIGHAVGRFVLGVVECQRRPSGYTGPIAAAFLALVQTQDSS
jgi:hypothetical protein